MMFSRGRFLSCLTVSVLFLALLSTAVAQEFQADMIQTSPTQTVRSDLYVTGTDYRMEIAAGGRDFIVLVDRKRGITRILLPAEKKYREMKNTSAWSRVNNPFESFRHSAEQYGRTELGRETFNGFDCRKVRVGSSDQDLFTAWVSDDLGFPLKIVNHLNQGVAVALDDIKQGPADAGMFDVPDAYRRTAEKAAGSARKKKVQGVKKKAWMAKVDSARVLTPPVDKEMEAGEILRFKIERDKAFHLFTSSGIKLYAFQQGIPVLNLKERRHIYLSPHEADEIVIYNPGRSRFASVARVKQGDMAEQVLTAGEEMRFEMQPGEEFACRYINISDSESTLYYTWLSKGESLPASEIGPDDFRTKTLRPGANFRSLHNQLQGEAPGDTLVTTVRQGTVLVKAGHPLQPKAAADTVSKPAASKAVSSKGPNKPASSHKPIQTAEQQATVASAPRQKSPARDQSAFRPANIMFILDASGSMWGEVEGRDKIDIAKAVMSRLIHDLPDDTRVGLIAYGHRQKGDCRDVEELVAMSPLNKSSLIETVTSISPKGKTPITRSVHMAAERVKALEEHTTVILVSDGKETCDGDPCALVKELKTAGLRFVLHVIGFDVTNEERDQLACMADAGGGRYFTAETAGQFQAAAQEVLEATHQVGFLAVRALRNDTPVSARVDVIGAETGKRVDRARTSADTDGPTIIRLEPGTYHIVVTDTELPGHPTQSFSNVEISLGEQVNRSARFEAGTLTLTASKDEKAIEALARVYTGGDLIDSGWLDPDEGGHFSLLPGTYNVVVQDKSIPEEPTVRMEDIRIKSGQTINRQVSFSQEGLLHLEAFKGGKSIHVLARVYKGADRVASAWLEENEGATFELLPGTYRVLVQDKSIPQNPEIVLTDLVLEPGQTVIQEVNFVQEGTLNVEAFKAGRSVHVYAQVYQGDDKVASAWLKENEGATFELLPGTYRVLVQDKSIPQNPEIVLTDLVLEPGQTVIQEVNFVQEGTLEVEAFEAGRSVHVYAKVYKDDDRIASAWLKENEGAAFKLLPGTYDVEIKDAEGNITEQRGIAIQSGKKVTVRMDL